MIVSVCQFDVVLIRIPVERLICEFLQAFAIEPVANNDGEQGAELSLDIDETS